MDKSVEDWNSENLEYYLNEIESIAIEYRLDTYPNQLELITSEQMIDAYSSTGMPCCYNHWSFGKQHIEVEKNYKHGYMGLAYEMVINSNPCISYLMEENSLTLQILVMAHACYGHNSFFKNNYLFKTWTDADSIIDYLVFAKKYISSCEEQYGIEKVEELLDACHALQNYGVDRYKRPLKLTLEEEQARQKSRQDYLQSQINELYKTLPTKNKKTDKADRFPKDKEENILFFLEKHAPLLESYEREIIRIVRNISQYFYPQKQTKVMNEGWATFWHYTILNTMYERNLVDDKFMVEFLHNHTNVIYQPGFDHPAFSGINPYTLGFHMFMDIKRICTAPTEEDKEWFPDLYQQDWLDAVHFAMENFKDESFISQYLSPKVIRDLHLFNIIDNEDNLDLKIGHIHQESDYQIIREELSKQYNLSLMEPNIQVVDVDIRGDRTLTLQYIPHDNIPLDMEYAEMVMQHLHKIWGFDCNLTILHDDGSEELLLAQTANQKEEVNEA